MKTWISYRAALGALAGAGIAGIALLLAVAAAAAPSLSVTATDAIIGQTIDATAQLSEGPTASGEISFEVFGPDDPTCAGPALTPTPPSASVTGEGEYSSGDFTPAEAGTYRWSARYSGDLENPAADSICSAASVVSKATPSLAGTASDGIVNTAIHDEVSVTGGFSPTGEVIFRIYAPTDSSCLAPLETNAVTIEDDEAISPDFVPQQAGEYRWTAEYTGDENNEAVSLPCGSTNQGSSVGKASPSLAGVASSATAGSAITDSAALSGAFAAGGQLVFRAYGPGDSSCADAPAYEATVAVNGDGSYSPAGFSPGAGSYRWTVEYAGDANNETADLACGAADQTSTVGKASPNITGVASSATVGSSITDSVALSGAFAAGGQLVFRAYGPGDASCADTPAYEATVAVNGDGSYSPAGFSPGAGSYRWTVVYAGDGNNEAVSLACGAVNQVSTVAKAAPSLVGTATSATVGASITDSVTLSGAFAAGGQLVFRAYGPGDSTCATTPKYEATVPVTGNASYSPPGFSPAPGLYRWVVDYTGDENNEAVSLPCGSTNQASAVGTVDVILTASATGNTISEPVSATASIEEGAIPAGQITFTAFSPGDVNCTGAPAFNSTVSVAGNGSYRSAPFVPTRVGTFRWTVRYSGDPNHAATTVGCGKAQSGVAQAKPSIDSAVAQQLTVGTSFEITAALQGAFVPTGTVSFRIYGPNAADCPQPLSVNTVPVSDNGTARSAPFVAQRPGHYIFAASYSGDASNQGAAEPCPAGATAQVNKRAPKVKPSARLKGENRISIRARLSGAISPSGAINFRLYRPGDKRCKGKPAFSGGVTVKANGSYLLAQYLATQSGTYRLSVGYSGDQRNRRYKGSCGSAQQIQIG